MAGEPRRFIVHISHGGGSSGGDGKKKSYDEKQRAKDEKSAMSAFRKMVSSPLQYIKSEKLGEAQEMYDSGNKAGGFALGIGIQAASTAINVAKQSADFAWNRYCTLQEDYMSQQWVNNAKDTINRVTGVANSAIQGGMVGASFGPIGAAAGALIGAVGYGFSQYTEYQKRMSNYYQQLNSTNFQTEFSASRYGLSGTEN